MKGISEVIAMILLLLVTVAIIGLAFGFFSRITSSAGTNTETQTANTLNNFAKQVSIDASTTTSVSVKNSGTVSITCPGPANCEVTVYVAGAPVTCTWSGSAFPLTPGSTAICTWVGACSGGQIIKVTSPANSVQVNC